MFLEMKSERETRDIAWSRVHLHQQQLLISLLFTSTGQLKCFLTVICVSFALYQSFGLWILLTTSYPAPATSALFCTSSRPIRALVADILTCANPAIKRFPPQYFKSLFCKSSKKLFKELDLLVLEFSPNMGKKNNKKTTEHKERVAAKQTKKADKKDKKSKTKGQDADSDAEEADLDAILAQYAEEQAKFLKVTEVVSGPPSPRSSATVLASPSNRNELLVFGGEYFDGIHATFFNNLFVYLIDRGEWREVTSPNSPLPRSGHAWCRGGNTGGVYLFGGKCFAFIMFFLYLTCPGEFSSPKQGTFYHYNDFWYLDPATREWSRIETKGKGPPARSGHRMTYFKVCPFTCVPS